MKKNFLFLVLLAGFSLNAQDFQGKADYFSKIIFKTDTNKKQEVDGKESELSPEITAMIQDALKKASEKKFTLTFNKQESLYEEVEELQKPEAANGGMTFSVSFSGQGKKYTNLKDKSTVSEDEIFGKEFLIVEKLEPLNWQLLDETKKIGDYTCYKAQSIIPVTEAQKKEYEESLKQEKKSNLFIVNEPKDKVVVAWYAPEIPVGFGPNNYWGLPGLILEINEDENIILCSKVTLSNKEKSKIKVPNTGQKVSKKEFDAIQKKKMDSMKDEDGNVIFQTTRD